MTRSGQTRLLGRALPGILFTLFVVAVYADPLLFRRNFAGRDLLAYNLPMEKAIHDSYSRGQFPVWMPEISGGRPLLPNPNSGALYPVRPLLALLPFPLAARIFPVLHWAASGIGVIVLLRSIGRSRAAAWVGAVIYAFSGVAVSEVFFPHIQPGMTLLPWILWAVRRPEARAARKALLLSLLYCLILLAGDVFTIGLALASSLLWIFLEMERREWKPAVSTLSLSLLLSLLLALPQILATALWIPETNRAVLGMRLQEVFFFSLSPLRLLEFLVPFPFGSTWALEPWTVWGGSVFHGKAVGLFTSLYAGAFPILGLVSFWKAPAPGARFARVLFLSGLALSIPPSFLPESFGKWHSPLPLRNPEKFAVTLVLALAIWAGLAFDHYRRSHRKLRWALAVGALLALAAGASALFPEPTGRLVTGLLGLQDRLAKTAADRLPGALAEGGLLWMAALVAVRILARSSRAAIAVSLLLLTLAMVAANRKIARTFREEEVFSPSLFARLLRRADPAGAYRTLGESLYRHPSKVESGHVGSDPGYLEVSRRNWHQHAQALWGRGTVFNHDFDVGDLSRLQSLRLISAMAAGFGDADVFFRSLSLRWGIRFRDHEPLPGYRRFGGDFLQDWDEQPGTFPDIRLAQSWVEETEALPAANVVPRLKEGEIVVETGSRRRGSARPGKVRVLEKRPERLLLEADATDPCWLFVLRNFWKHRRVYLDGVEVEDYPAQLAFSAIRVPAGKHRIDWRERVPGGEISRFGPVLFCLSAALLLVRERKRDSRT